MTNAADMTRDQLIDEIERLHAHITALQGRSEDSPANELLDAHRVMVEHAMHGLAIIQDGRIVFANPAFARLTGRSLPDLLALDTAGVKTLLHPDDRTSVIDAFTAQTTSAQAGEQRRAYRLVTQAGETRWVQTAATVVQYGGQPALYVEHADVTPQMQAVAARREAEAHLRSIFDHTEIGIFRSTAEGRFLFVNPALARMLGYDSPGEVLAHVEDIAAQIYVDPTRRAEIVAFIQGAEKTAHFVNHYRRRSGETWWGSLYLRVVRDAHDQPLHLEGFVEDITERKQAEDALRESEERLRASFDTELVGWAISRRSDGVYLDANPGFLAITGYERDEIIGHSSQELGFFTPELRQTMLASLDEEGRLHNQELTFPTKSGEQRTILFSLGPVTLGGEACLLATMLDITERKQAQDALRESEERFRGIFKSAAVGVAMVDEAGVVLRANPRLGEMLGCPPEDLIGENFADFTHPDDLPREWELINEMWAEGRATYQMEKRYIRRDGGIIWVRVTASPIRDDTGQIRFGIGVAEDISEHKLAEDALRESEARFRGLFESAAVGIAVFSSEGTLVEINPALCQMLGYQADELRGIHFAAITHRDGLEAEQALMRELVASRRNEFLLEKHYIRKDGSIMWGRLTGSIVRDDQGDYLYGIGIVEDITARRQAEEALREAEQRYRTVADFTYDWEYWQAPDGSLRYVSPACERITGYSADEFITRPALLREIVLPEDRPAWDAHHRDLADRPPAIQFRIRRRDGGTRWIEHVCRPVTGADGTFLGYRASNRDITARRMARQALRESEERFRRLYEQAPLAYQSLDTDGCLVEVNRAWLEMLGYERREEVLGRSFGDFMTDEARAGFHVDFPAFKQAGQMCGIERTMVRKDGEHVLVSIDGRIGHDAQGRFQQTHCILINITARRQAEEQIRYQASLLENVHDAIISTDLDRRIVSWNRAAEVIYGYTAEEALGRQITRLLRTEIPGADAETPFQGTLEAGHWEGEYIHTRKDGQRVYIFSIANLVHDAGGNPIGLVLVGRDITERKWAETQLRQSEEKHRLLFENAQTGLLRARLASGQVIDANQRAAEMFGFGARAEIIGHFISEFYARPAERQDLVARLQRDGAFRGLTLQGRRVDGSTVWLEISAWLNPAGTIIESVLVDVTDRKKAQEDLQAARDQLDAILQGVGDAIYAVDRRGHLIYANDAAAHATGYRSAEKMMEAHRDRDPIADFEFFDEDGQPIPPDQLPSHQAMQGRVTSAITARYRKQGTDAERWVIIKAMPITGERGKLQFAVVITTDITQRKRAEQHQLDLAMERERVHVLERFIGDATHDLYTPLSAMKVSLYVLERTRDPEKRHRQIDALKRQSRHLERLLRDLLSMVQLERESETWRTPIDLNPLAQDVLTEHESIADQHGHAIVFMPAPAPLMVNADRARLNRALAALVTNALHYTPQGGIITLRTRQRNGLAVVEVEDTGIGIEPDDLPHIFERFYRADAARSTDLGGMGLGLPIALKIVEQHQGLIEVESHPGQGSIFRIVLPLAEAQA